MVAFIINSNSIKPVTLKRAEMYGLVKATTYDHARLIKIPMGHVVPYRKK